VPESRRIGIGFHAEGVVRQGPILCGAMKNGALKQNLGLSTEG
jgi:hypothetical protein